MQIAAIVIQTQRHANGATQAEPLQQWHGAVMTGAHGNTLFAQQVGEVGMVHAVDHKAGQGDGGRTEQAYTLALLQPGDQVALTKGPFANFVAEVEMIAPDRRVWVLMEIMGAQTRVAVGADQLRAV